MLQENLKRLRQERGLSQEAMAQELHVVRQTVSKWEKGSSVPDADMLKQIAELFGVSVSQLLEEAEARNVDEVALQLALLNQRLANRERRTNTILKWVAGILVVLLFVWLIVNYGGSLATPGTEPETVVLVTCTLDGETYTYTIDCSHKGRIMGHGGDPWLCRVVEEHFTGEESAEDLIRIIEDYILPRGGTVEVEEFDFDSLKYSQNQEQPIYAEGK